MTRHWQKIVCMTPLLVASIPALAAERAIVVLDGSGSMWAQIEGVARISIARDTLDTVLGELPPSLELGFMTYGHRERGQCSDIELLVPPAAGTGPAISAAARAINPKGMTPISDAVKRAAEELRFTEEKATVILITDGLETCNADPCALASDLETAGIDFTTHVVGFGLSDEEGRQVACLAENTGGSYLGADDAASLVDALTRTVAAVAQPVPPDPAPAAEPVAPEFNLLPVLALAEGAEDLPRDAGNAWQVYARRADGAPGEWVGTEYSNGARFDLEPGAYVLVGKLGEASVSRPITIAAGEVEQPRLVLDAGTVTIRPRGVEGGDVVSGAALVFTLPDGREATYYGETTLVLPAGEQSVRARIGEGEAVANFALAAGELVEKDIIVGVGRAVVNASYRAGMKVEDGDVFFEIFAAKTAIDGSRRSLSYNYGADGGHDLPPGDYVLVARLGAASAEAPFSIRTGERTDIDVTLGAGVLAITAPGTDFVEIFGAARDIQGNRKSFGYGYGGALQTTLPAGDYVVLAHPPGGGTAKEGSVGVAAGERSELRLD